jgi:hypothetical protein
MADPSLPSDPDATNPDDLFGKLDSLISKHQGALASRGLTIAVPVLTEAVDAERQTGGDVPVLKEAVDLSEESAAIAGRRRQLQVALYLRLRQRLDAELHVALSSHPAFTAAEAQPALARLAEELRAALPEIVRDSIAQVFGPEAGKD